MGVEGGGERCAGAEGVFAFEQRFAAGGVHLGEARVRAADDDRSHECGVVVPPAGREFERQEVLGVEVPPTAVVPAHERAGAGADHLLVRGIVAAAAEDRALQPR